MTVLIRLACVTFDEFDRPLLTDLVMSSSASLGNPPNYNDLHPDHRGDDHIYSQPYEEPNQEPNERYTAAPR